MIRTVLTMVVREGAEGRFEQVWAEAARGIAQAPGNAGQVLLREPAAPRTYLVSSDWESPDALAAFEDSPGRRLLSAELEPLRESARKAVYDVVARVGVPGTAGART